MDKFVKFAAVIGLLLAGFGVFYHYVIFLPDIEREKAEIAEREKLEKVDLAERLKQEAERQRAVRQWRYDSCIKQARANYDANWAVSCESAAISAKADFKHCLADKQVMSNQFMG